MICRVENCGRKHDAKGYCGTHYKRFKKGLSLNTPVKPQHYHGLTSRNEEHSLYRTWNAMRQRCNNPHDKNYKNYGGRGITVCERWDNFALFVEDMGEKPTPKHTLDRYPNNDGNYEPSNVRWATRIEQAANQRLRKNNPSGYRGVGWDKQRQKWVVYYFGKYNGRFATKEEAIAKRQELENKQDFNDSMEDEG